MSSWQKMQHTNKETKKETHKQTDNQTNKQTNKQTNRQTNIQNKFKQTQLTYENQAVLSNTDTNHSPAVSSSFSLAYSTLYAFCVSYLSKHFDLYKDGALSTFQAEENCRRLQKQEFKSNK